MLYAVNPLSLVQSIVGPAMHIPDGYLSPLSAAVMYALALPFWYLASQKVRRALTTRMVPVIALFAAFSFVIMMFNIPLPGGTTGHAVGGTLAAIILGPWASVIAISIALAIQALFFGDGGILAFGANAFNMAIVLPFVGYYIYRLISGASAPTSSRRVVAAAMAGYVALNVAAVLTAVEFGVQPYFFKAADGTPLYNPYGLNVAIPAMMSGHLLIAGLAEALITGLVVAYLQRANLPLLQLSRPEVVARAAPGWRGVRALWIGLATLVVLTPLGLLASGTAWGEWGLTELRDEQGLGFIPQGLARWGERWSAPLPDYAVPGLGQVPGYVLSAVAGIALIAVAVWLISRALARRQPQAEG
ncbi:MAG: cobalt transporter CbiM [Anaerolineae bacterium]